MVREKDVRTISRRTFMGAVAVAAFAFSIVPGKVMGEDAPSNKLNIACIGAAGRGWANLRGVEGQNIVALCDVDLERAKNNFNRYPSAKKFRDFRVMFDKMEKDIDAVIVSTPDHTHYIAAMAAMERGKHVYCEKPLAHSVYEVREMMSAARKYKVQTQMGNQGHSDEHIRLVCEWVQDGAIGDVREVHAWSNRPQGGYAFPSSLPRPTETPPVPDTLDWKLWLGPVKERPYHPIYAPVFWRGWLDFGTGALGDMGCHILDPAFWALKLGGPASVIADTSYNPGMDFWGKVLDGSKRWKSEIGEDIAAMKKETYPAASRVTWEFGARGDMPPVKLTWWDGGIFPPPHKDMPKGFGGNGALIIGDKGAIKHGSHGANGARIVPEEKMQAYIKSGAAKKTIKRVDGHHQDWINACKGGDPAGSNFDYGGALTEMVLLGVIAMRNSGAKLLWDDEKMEFEKNKTTANELVKPEYHNGWTL
ncbi:MAG: Gfo/Idh/MocA family oxidoreductase [Planctomycetes bacterium]|nr:Gfo/Idh/MocA family oxidoreductase [Planctomycetota bacterium]